MSVLRTVYTFLKQAPSEIPYYQYGSIYAVLHKFKLLRILLIRLDVGKRLRNSALSLNLRSDGQYYVRGWGAFHFHIVLLQISRIENELLDRYHRLLSDITSVHLAYDDDWLSTTI